MRQETALTRNIGIDLLRLVSMFYVVLLHALGRGGVFAHVSPNSLTYHAAWFLEIWAMCAVDIFALTTGYVDYRPRLRPVRLSRWMEMWLQAVSLGVLALAATYVVRPHLVTTEAVIATFTPVTSGWYWYLTAYTGFVVLQPILRAGTTLCSERTLAHVAVGIVAVGAYEALTGGFRMSAGYSCAWLCLCYVVGVALRRLRCGMRLPALPLLACLVGLNLAGWAWEVLGISGTLFGIVSWTPDLFATPYTTPTVFLSAVLHVLLFARLTPPRLLTRIIAWAAPAAFATYLLNCNVIVWSHVMPDLFVPLLGTSGGLTLVCCVLFSAAFVVSSCVIDRGRMALFRRLHVGQGCERIEARIRAVLDHRTSRHHG